MGGKQKDHFSVCQSTLGCSAAAKHPENVIFTLKRNSELFLFIFGAAEVAYEVSTALTREGTAVPAFPSPELQPCQAFSLNQNPKWDKNRATTSPGRIWWWLFALFFKCCWPRSSKYFIISWEPMCNAAVKHFKSIFCCWNGIISPGFCGN